MNKRNITLHPFLIALYPILFLYHHNIGELWLSDLMTSTCVASFFVIVSFLILKKITRNTIKTGLLTSLLWAGFYLYSDIGNLFNKFVINSPIAFYIFLILLFILLSRKQLTFKLKENDIPYKSFLLYSFVVIWMFLINIVLTDFVHGIKHFFIVIIIAISALVLFVFLLKKMGNNLTYESKLYLFHFSKFLFGLTFLYIIIYQSQFEIISHSILLPFYGVMLLIYSLIAWKFINETLHRFFYLSLLLFIIILTGIQIDALYNNLLSEIAYVLLILILCNKIIKSHYNFIKINTVLNFFTSALILFPLIGIIYFETNYFFSKKSEITQIQFEGLSPQENLPDIYFVVLDEYASSSSIKKLFKYDNGLFEEAMRQKGFYVDEWQTFSSHTPEVISGVLNLDKSTVNKEIAFENFNNIKHNKLSNFLQKFQYKIAQFPMWRYEKYTAIEHADTLHKVPNNGLKSELKDYNSKILFRTLVQRYITNKLEFYQNAINYIYKQLPKIKEEVAVEDPLFVYAHFICPHAPFVFDSLGVSIGRQYDGNKYYLGQYVFTNNMVLDLADKLKMVNDGNNVIIFQSDHGPREGETGIKTNILQERKIFTAIYFPDGDYSLVNESPKLNSNTFKIVLNKYFKTGLEWDAND
ncbi:MAG: hypothetical protein PHT69_16410 [Bacteroidales bacterium]|nr:hypothetical protein [Bacteroidales bacterium]